MQTFSKRRYRGTVVVVVSSGNGRRYHRCCHHRRCCYAGSGKGRNRRRPRRKSHRHHHVCDTRGRQTSTLTILYKHTTKWKLSRWVESMNLKGLMPAPLFVVWNLKSSQFTTSLCQCWGNTLFICYKYVIFWLKPLKEIEIATNKITTMFLILEQFQALMFL